MGKSVSGLLQSILVHKNASGWHWVFDLVWAVLFSVALKMKAKAQWMLGRSSTTEPPPHRLSEFELRLLTFFYFLFDKKSKLGRTW